MNNDLELLLKLQVIDYDIGELERSKEYLPDMMSNLRREIDETSESLGTTKASLEEARINQKNLELDIATKEQSLQKFQQQMMSIKTNKEYDALVAEIDTLKTQITEAETELIETIDRIAELEKALEEHAEKMGQVEENNKKQLDILQNKVDTIGDKMADKLASRKDVASSIPRPTLNIYERVRRGKGGTVVVVVKKRACGACYKSLTPKKVQEIKKAAKIHTCDNCGRLMFWEEEESN
ncbi:MAG: C4-type zinc ribbon domain-containing protein [bacterium]|nr:C4-type zinc ribbon domain-containing protein [bacterium]